MIRIEKIKAKEGKIVEPPGEKIREIYSDKEIGVAEATVKEAQLHYHKKMHEYYYVLQGEGKVKLDNRIITLKKGDFLHIPPKTKHKAYSKKKFKILVITRKPWNEKDHYIIEKKS